MTAQGLPALTAAGDLVAKADRAVIALLAERDAARVELERIKAKAGEVITAEYEARSGDAYNALMELRDMIGWTR